MNYTLRSRPHYKLIRFLPAAQCSGSTVGTEDPAGGGRVLLWSRRGAFLCRKVYL